MSDVIKTDEMWSELHHLLKDMDVPPDRYNDINWLNINLRVRNIAHPNFSRASDLSRAIMKEIRLELRKHPANQNFS